MWTTLEEKERIFIDHPHKAPYQKSSHVCTSDAHTIPYIENGD